MATLRSGFSDLMFSKALPLLGRAKKAERKKMPAGKGYKIQPRKLLAEGKKPKVRLTGKKGPMRGTKHSRIKSKKY